MSAINSIGQAIFQYIESEKTAESSDAQKTQPISQTDPDGDGNNGSAIYAGEGFTPAGEALLMTLEQYGINAGHFERDFLAALKKNAHDRMKKPLPRLARSPEHINTVA